MASPQEDSVVLPEATAMMCGSKSVAYFTHDPAHRLLPAAGDGDADADGVEFICGGCRVAGAGPRYRCGHPGCDFTIHEACARRFPRTLKSAVHPQHRLRRRESAAGADDVHGGEGGCEVCGEDVKGAFYACAACGVAVHPLCARMPGVARGPAHPPEGHEAWLVRVTSSAAPPAPDDDGDAKKQVAASSAGCAACGRPVGAWRYRCATCGAELHPRCLVPAADQCRGDGEGQECTAKSCCFGLLDQVANCMAITGFGYHYRFQK